MINEIEKLAHLCKLKEVERTASTVKNRPESTAEHIYSCLVLAQYFLPRIHYKLDELKVFRMLLAHDLAEIETGDFFLYNEAIRVGKEEKEREGFKTLCQKIPSPLGEDFFKLWCEFEEKKTPEAKFCHAIDKIDPIIHTAFHKEDWKSGGITEAKLRTMKEKTFEEFPAMLEIFHSFIEHAKKNDYFGE